MNNFKHITLTIFILYILIPDILKAEEYSYKTISLAFGTSNFNEEDFRSIELRGNYSLPFFNYTAKDRKFELLPVVNLSFGSLKQDQDIVFFSTLTSGIAIIALNNSMILDAAGGFAFLTDDQIGARNFGGYFQLAAHTGIYYKLTQNVLIGYRFYHISDAGIFDGHGLNRHLLKIGYSINF
jgi:hypothetical protein